jgi:hypothetical protein
LTRLALAAQVAMQAVEALAPKLAVALQPVSDAFELLGGPA